MLFTLKFVHYSTTIYYDPHFALSLELSAGIKVRNSLQEAKAGSYAPRGIDTLTSKRLQLTPVHLHVITPNETGGVVGLTTFASYKGLNASAYGRLVAMRSKNKEL